MKRIVTSFCAVLMAVLMIGSVSQQSYAQGNAPVAENLELKTYRNVSVGGMLSAYDSDEDVVSFEITTHPIKGEIELNADGRDYFGYKAIDSQGNYSQEATVIIRIEKQKTEIKYSDMNGKAGEFAAVELAEQGIFVGEKIGGEYCFNPDREVSKGEFLAMSMILSNEPLVTSVMNLGLENEDSVPTWLKNYICSAKINSEINSSDWNKRIDKSEAVALLNSCLKITDVRYINHEESLDNELAQACANLSACGIIRSGEPLFDKLSRADAAQMLCNSLSIKNNR